MMSAAPCSSADGTPRSAPAAMPSVAPTHHSQGPRLHPYRSHSLWTIQLLGETLPVAAEGVRLPVVGARGFHGPWRICAVRIHT